MQNKSLRRLGVDSAQHRRREGLLMQAKSFRRVGVDNAEHGLRRTRVEGGLHAPAAGPGGSQPGRDAGGRRQSFDFATDNGISL